MTSLFNKIFNKIKTLPREYNFEHDHANVLAADALQIADLLGDQQTENLCLQIVARYPLYIRFITNRTDKIRSMSVKKNYKALGYIPREERSTELYHQALSNSGWAIELIEEEKRTYELWLCAVTKDGLVLRLYRLWGKEITPEEERLCIAAINQDINACSYAKFITPAIKAAVSERLKTWTDMKSITFTLDKFLSEEECIVIIHKCPSKIRLVEVLTYRMCYDAVIRDVNLLSYIPKTIENYATIEVAAIRLSPSIIDTIDSELQTEEMRIAAVSSRPLMVFNLTHPSITVWYEAIKQMPWLINKCPNKSTEAIEFFLEKNPSLLSYCDEIHYTHLRTVKAIRNNPSCIKSLKKNMITEDLWLEALDLLPSLLSSLDIKLPYYESVCLKMIAKDHTLIRYIRHPTESIKRAAMPPVKLTQEQADCSVCDKRGNIVTPCSHILCKSCYEAIMTVGNGRCSMCRESLMIV